MSEQTTALIHKGSLTWQQQRDLARWAADTKQFKHIRSPAQAMLLIQYGRDMGFGPGQSLQAVYEVNGVPTLKAGTISALLKAMKWEGTQKSKYDYRVIERTATRCLLEFYERNDEGKMELRGPSEFTIEDAKRAGLIKPNSGWQKFPRDMLFARAVTAGVRTYAPDCLGGIVPYCTEEMTNTDQEGTPILPEKGEIVDAEFELKDEVTEQELDRLSTEAATKGTYAVNVLQRIGVVPNKEGEYSPNRSQYEAALRIVENL